LTGLIATRLEIFFLKTHRRVLSAFPLLLFSPSSLRSRFAKIRRIHVWMSRSGLLFFPNVDFVIGPLDSALVFRALCHMMTFRTPSLLLSLFLLCNESRSAPFAKLPHIHCLFNHSPLLKDSDFRFFSVRPILPHRHPFDFVYYHVRMLFPSKFFRAHSILQDL